MYLGLGFRNIFIRGTVQSGAVGHEINIYQFTLDWSEVSHSSDGHFMFAFFITREHPIPTDLVLQRSYMSRHHLAGSSAWGLKKLHSVRLLSQWRLNWGGIHIQVHSSSLQNPFP